MSDVKDRTFVVQMTTKIELTEQDAFPDLVAQAFLEKIKTKIHCNRETMELVGTKTEIWEVYEEPDEED